MEKFNPDEEYLKIERDCLRIRYYRFETRIEQLQRRADEIVTRFKFKQEVSKLVDYIVS